MKVWEGFFRSQSASFPTAYCQIILEIFDSFPTLNQLVLICTA